MTVRRNVPWTGDDFAILEQMVAAGDSMPAIARVLQRSQVDVAGKTFALRQSAGRDA